MPIVPMYEQFNLPMSTSLVFYAVLGSLSQAVGCRQMLRGQLHSISRSRSMGQVVPIQLNIIN